MNLRIFTYFIICIVVVFPILIFDLIVSSHSIIPFRYLYDISFSIIIIILTYISILLIKNEKILKTKYVVNIPKKYITIVSTIISIILIINSLNLNQFEITIQRDVFLQGIIGIMSIAYYIIIIIIVSLVFYISFDNEVIKISKIWSYTLGAIAFLVSLTIYGFNFYGLYGVHASFLIFCSLIIILILRIHLNLKSKYIILHLTNIDCILCLISISTFLMFYYTGVYSFYSDQAVSLSSLLSLVYRGSLKPYYIQSEYYSSLSGFISLDFVFITGYTNLLLASTLPFFLGYIAIPFICYHFIRSNIIQDERIVLLGSLMTIFMDGLAILVLPKYLNKLNFTTIYWDISTKTCSLRLSTLIYFWLNPYKIWAMATAFASLDMSTYTSKKYGVNLIFSGLLLALSFVHPRQSFNAMLGFILLYILRKISFRKFLIILTTVFISYGKELLPISICVLKGIFFYAMRIISLKVFKEIYSIILTTPPYTNSMIILYIDCFLFILLIFMTKKPFQKVLCNYPLDIKSEAKRIRLIFFKDRKYFSISFYLRGFIYAILSLSIFMYAIAYSNNFFHLMSIIEDQYIFPLNYFILRYHIGLILTLTSLFLFRRIHRIFFAYIFLLALQYMGVLFWLNSPFIIVVMTLPGLNWIAKSNDRLTKAIILSFIFLGIFSGTLFAATQQYNSFSTLYTDIPGILPKLLVINPCERIYCPSYYKYYAYRLAGFAHLKISSNPLAKYSLIDTYYIKGSILNELISKNKVIYHGSRFILLKKKC